MKYSKDDNLIPKEDYSQVFSETLSSMLDGIMKLAVEAEIKDALHMVDTWSKFHWRRHGGDKIKRIN